jgi:DNA-binding NtrC family response regulator
MPQVSDKHDLSGMRVLVVEDTMLVADLISEELKEAGCAVVGPAGHLTQALALAEAEALNGAFLDLNLGGESSVPVAEVLERRGIPYVFITGYDDLGSLPAAYRDKPRLAKPFDPDRLAVIVAQQFRK